MLMRLYRNHKTKVRFLMMLLGLIFISLLALNYKNEFLLAVKGMHVNIFVLSILLGVLGNVVTGLYFRSLLAKYAVDISPAMAVNMHLIGQIAKYIPGKIWGMLYQASFLNDKKSAVALLLANLELMLASIYLTLCSVGLLLLYLFRKNIIYSLIFVFFTTIIFVVFYRSALIIKLLKRILKHYRYIADFDDKREYKYTNRFIAMFLFIFISISLAGNLLMLMSVFHLDLESSTKYLAIMSIAWIISVFAFVVPAGIGVKEVVFIFLSSLALPEVSTSMITLIAVVSRIWVILQELLGCVLISAYNFFLKKYK